MHVVLVLLKVKPDRLTEFEQALLHNARESVARDPGCLRFDVSQHVDDPTQWVLHEVYDTPAAHAAHRQSPHFLAYDALAREVVVEKSVARCTSRHLPS
jgi:quinol monooxygenase YgiN